MHSCTLLLAGAGTRILLDAWLPMALRELPLSLPMFGVAFGFGAFSLAALAGGPWLPRGLRRGACGARGRAAARLA
jgi:hypothetical protein